MARVFDESFEGTGYEHTWTENTNGGIVNEDASIPGTPPTGSGSQCLRTNIGANSSACYSSTDYGSTLAIAYIRAYLYVDSHAIGTDGNVDHVLAFGTSSPDLQTNSFGVRLRTSGTQLQLYPNYHIAAGWQNLTAANIAVDTWYRVEVLMDTTNSVVEWRLDGTQIQRVTGVTLDRGGCRYSILGKPYAGATPAADVYFDLFAIDNATWVGEESAASNSASPSSSPSSSPSASASNSPSSSPSSSASDSPSSSPSNSPSDSPSASASNSPSSSPSASNSASPSNSPSSSASSSPSASPSPALGDEVVVTTGAAIGTAIMTAIPRWKLAFHPANASVLYLVHGRNDTNGSVWRSLNGGATWGALGTQVVTDYHANIDVDSSGRVYIGVPCGYDGTPDDPGELRRWNGSSWDTDVAFDLFSGTYTQVNILKGSGNDVWAFVRSTYGGTGTTYWLRSTDNGATFGSATELLATGDVNWKRMGSLWISGNPAALVSYITGGVYRYRILRWDGTDSFDAIANDTIDAATNSEDNRRYSFNQTDDGEIHLVHHDYDGATPILRYAHKSLTGTWSTQSTICNLTATGMGEPTLAVRGNTLFLFYTDSRSAVKHVYFRYLVSGTYAWSDELQIDTNGGVGNVSTCRTVPETSLPVAWDEDAGGGTRRIVFLSLDIADLTDSSASNSPSSSASASPSNSPSASASSSPSNSPSASASDSPSASASSSPSDSPSASASNSPSASASASPSNSASTSPSGSPSSSPSASASNSPSASASSSPSSSASSSPSGSPSSSPSSSASDSPSASASGSPSSSPSASASNSPSTSASGSPSDSPSASASDSPSASASYSPAAGAGRFNIFGGMIVSG